MFNNIEEALDYGKSSRSLDIVERVLTVRKREVKNLKLAEWTLENFNRRMAVNAKIQLCNKCLIAGAKYRKLD